MLPHDNATSFNRTIVELKYKSEHAVREVPYF